MQDNELFRKALDRALYYLGFRARTKAQMRTYLLSKEYDALIVEEVIIRLEELGYLNDALFAQRLVEAQGETQKKGRRAIEQKLYHAGLEDDIRTEALNELDQETQIQNACFWIEKIWNRLKNDPKGKEKLYRRLMGKGFDYEIIKKATRECEALFAEMD